MNAKIIGVAFLVTTSLLAGCENKQADGNNNPSVYSGACDKPLTQIQKNAAWAGDSLAQDIAKAVAEHGEQGLADKVDGPMMLRNLSKFRTPVNDEVRECARRANLESYDKYLAEARLKLKDKK